MLIVEDEPYMAEAIRDGLRLEAIAADIAGDGDAACEWAREAAEPFAAALLDLRMPGGGIETARALRALDAELPILLQSGFDADDAVARSGLDGAIAFLAKPFTPTELGTALRSLIARSERKQA